MVADDALRLVPAAFVHAHHAAANAGDTAVGQEVRRVGKDHVHGFVAHPAQQFQGIGLVEAQRAVGSGVKRRRRVGIAGAGFLDEISGEFGYRGHERGGTGRRIGGVRSVEQGQRVGREGGKVGQRSDSSQGESDPILPDPRRRDQGANSGVICGSVLSSI